MKHPTLQLIAVPCLLLVAALAHGQPKDVLPPGVKAVWDLSKAQHDTTPTRERVCLNGLWRFQPARTDAAAPPTGAWGYFKVPAFWPGHASYIQEDTQTLFKHPSWKGTNERNITSAWYEREVTVPDGWKGRRIALAADCVNSLAIVFVDGKKAGEIRFPGGELDLTNAIASAKPQAAKHTLSLLVYALPLKGVLLSYSDTNSAREVKGEVERRGLCGDVFLTSTPAERITAARIDTSVRKGELTLTAWLDGLKADRSCALRVKIRDHGKDVHEFTSKAFKSGDLTQGRLRLSDQWKPAKLWDTHTPENMLTAEITLLDGDSKVVDEAYPVRFGYREFWIDGKDFYLNGSRIFLSAVPIHSAAIGARTASYEGARETMKRLKSFGINFVYGHNYGCEPGSHVSFSEVLRAADDAGMLVAFSQPHFGHYDWKKSTKPQGESSSPGGLNGPEAYARHAAYYVKAAENHPAVVAYSMSHNATGYDDDMNPAKIDGIGDAHADNWSKNNAILALRAEAIVKALDPARIVYHHSSGNLGSMHTCNFYTNFVPIQEMSDWFGHWSTKGVKPLFLVEYGVPFSWDWTMYRGWYKGKREWGSAQVPWEFCQAEWSAQFLGDKAYKIAEGEKRNIRYEANHFKKGTPFYRWDEPVPSGSPNFDDQQTIMAQYITDNWRAFRTQGVSAISPWEHSMFWKLKPGVNKGRRELKFDWDNLQKPGFSAEYTQRQSPDFANDFDAADWEPTAAGTALLRNNQPLLAYIAGKEGNFTSQNHNYLPGETVEKQLIVINNSRKEIECGCECSWRTEPGKGSNDPPNNIIGKMVAIPTGNQVHIPLRISLPKTLPAGKYRIEAGVKFGTGETQTDSFTINVLPLAGERETARGGKIALFDPKGDTAKLLGGLGVKFQPVDAKTDLAPFDLLIVGRGALTPDGPAPNIDRVKDGLKVIVFEQTSKVLEQRFGFRVQEYGLRNVFPRVPDHPLLAGLKEEHLHDWRGEATLLPPTLDAKSKPMYGPMIKWCGLDLPRLWRCGNRGNVASVLIEKPARGDFLPIVDGGYALQYTPLMEYHEGKGLVLFCQLDVTGRTQSDPVADILTRNIVNYVSTWKPQPTRQTLYSGDAAGKRQLEAAGFTLGAYAKDKLSPNTLLVVSHDPDSIAKLALDRSAIADCLKAGGRVLAIGLDQDDARAILPVKVTMKKQEHIAAYLAPAAVKSPLAGIASADVHNRDPRQISLVTGEADVSGDGVLATAQNGKIVFCQLAPWQFESKTQMNLRRTYRRTSCLLSRLGGNLGAHAATPLLERFRTPVSSTRSEQRWLTGFYLDVPEEWDDPYRHFRW